MRNAGIVFGVTLILLIVGMQAKSGAANVGDFIAGGVLMGLAAIEAVIFIIGTRAWELDQKHLTDYRINAIETARIEQLRKAKPNPFGR